MRLVKTIGLLIFLSGLPLLMGCAQVAVENPPESETQQVSEKVITSFYPLYELATNIGGAAIDVTNLVTPGSEPHDYEPSPQDVEKLIEASIIFINGAGFEPWVEKIKPDLEEKKVQVIEMSANIKDLLENPVHEEAETQAEDPDHIDLPFDPHFWLDPVLYLEEARVLTTVLKNMDPLHSENYEQNFAAYSQKLKDLDQKYQVGLATCKYRSFVTSHAAFGYLARRYNLEMVPISGLSPETEPSARKIAELATYVKKLGIKYIFSETLISPKVAQTLADEVGINVLVLNPLEGLTPEEITNGENYVSVMEKNLTNLTTALECEKPLE